MEPSKATSVNSRAEELFVQLFCEAFGPEKTENLQVQYPCVDIYGRHRYIDFALESPESKIAIEIDGETYHNPSKVSENKYAGDILKQNSLIYDNWKVYRWIYSQLEKQPEKVKDELITFLGTSPMFKAFEADLPVQMGQTIELRDYQQEATENLQKMREDGKTIALLYHKDGKVKPDLSIPFGDKRMFHYFREESIRNIAKQYGWDLITPQNMADKFMKFIETMDMSYSYKPVLLKAIYEYMDTSGRVALPDVVDYFIDFYKDRKAHGMIAEKSTSIYQNGGYTRKDVEKNILSNPFKRFEDMRFLMRCKDVETIEVNPIIFRKLTKEDWLHIVDVCDKSLEKYYLRLKK